MAARRLSDCSYPLIVAGGGCKGDGGCGGSAAALVRQLAEQLGAPVLTTVAGKGVLPEDHFLSGGSRLHFPAMQRALLAKADGVLLLGTQLSPTDYWQFQHDKEVPVPFNANTLHVNLDAQNLEEVGVAARGDGAAGRRGGRLWHSALGTFAHRPQLPDMGWRRGGVRVASRVHDRIPQEHDRSPHV